MDYLVLLYGLLIFSGVFIYMVLVFKLSDWCNDHIHAYVSFFVWMMGYVGIPLAVLFSFIIS